MRAPGQPAANSPTVAASVPCAGPSPNFATSAAGLAIACIFTNPADVAKTRLQVQVANVNGELPYSNMFDCLQKMKNIIFQ